MDNITLGQIFAILAWIGGSITTLGVIFAVLTKFYNWLKKKNNEPILNEIKTMKNEILSQMETQDKILNERIDNIDEGQCKNFLVNFFRDKENNLPIDPIEEKRAFEIYEHYSKPKSEGGLGCNSYIHQRWNKIYKIDKDE